MRSYSSVTDLFFLTVTILGENGGSISRSQNKFHRVVFFFVVNQLKCSYHLLKQLHVLDDDRVVA